MTQSTPEEALFALEFLARHQADLAAGRQLGLADYQALYPGREALVAEEWRRLTGDVADRPPQRIAHYLVERELGSGGQGRVYLARDERLGRQVALKVLHVHGPMAQPYLARFRREAEIAARLDHPGICTVFDTGQCDGLTYIAMRYVAGVSLAERLRQLRADPDAHLGSTEALFGVVRMIERAARAVHAAHQAGILHRDLKPGNIMVGEADVPVILDFGLARDDRDGDSAALTRTGELFGTPLYMAPEQLRGDASLDRRADVYALGATLYEALTLHRPYEGATRESLFSQLLDSEPVSVKKLNRTLPRDLCVVVETAMARERDRRYRTAEDFAEDLRRVGEYRPIEASPTSRAVRAWRWCRRNRAVAALSGLLFVALCSGLAASLVLLRSSEEARRQLQDSLTDIQAGRQSRRSRELERLLSNAYQQL
ncbi:MAG: serine/threonine protein kinase [Planctomycetes bacterium]|nr:serine/threonine protein kinase [Planctomycetota bacterium]